MKEKMKISFRKKEMIYEEINRDEFNHTENTLVLCNRGLPRKYFKLTEIDGINVEKKIETVN